MIPIVSKKAETSKKPQGEPGTLISVCVNSVNQWIPRICAKFEMFFSSFKCEMYITKSQMAELLMLKSNYNPCQPMISAIFCDDYCGIFG